MRMAREVKRPRAHVHFGIAARVSPVLISDLSACWAFKASEVSQAIAPVERTLISLTKAHH